MLKFKIHLRSDVSRRKKKLSFAIEILNYTLWYNHECEALVVEEVVIIV